MLLLCGVLTYPPGMIMGFLIAAGILRSDTFGHDGFYFGVALPGMFVALLALLPTDHDKIRIFFRIVALYWIGGASLVLVMVSVAASGLDGFAHRSCNQQDSACVAFLAHWTLVCFIAFATAAILLRDVCQISSMSSRALLMRMWFAMRLCYFGFGIATLLYLIVYSLVEPPFVNSLAFWGTATHAVGDVICPLLFTARNRRRLHGWIRKMAGMKSGDRRAAAIASMIAGVGPVQAKALASQNFRVLPFSRMRHEDLLNGDLASPCDELRSRTRGCNLGACDAFMSHSSVSTGSNEP